MNREKNLWDLVVQNLEEAKELGKKMGLTGTTHCHSCGLSKPALGSIQSGSGTKLCEDCYLIWAKLNLRGLVGTVDDVVPSNKTCH